MHVVIHPDMRTILDKVVLMIAGGLRQAGYEPVVGESIAAVPAGERAIVLGANHFGAAGLAGLSRNSVVLNVENASSPFITADYLALMRKFHVWDYSASNAAALAQMLGRPVEVLKFFYCDEVRRLAHDKPKDIDLLFYGWLNERRLAVLQALAQKGVAVHAATNAFGDELDALLERSKAVINIHFYENGSFEIVRVFDLLTNGCAVISEVNDGEAVDADLLAAIAWAPYPQLAAAAEALVRDEGRLQAVAAAGLAAISQRAGGAIMADLLNKSTTPVLPSAANIGSGKAFKSEMLNIDINGQFNPDVVADLAGSQLFTTTHRSDRFGDITLQPGWFSQVVLTDVLEHIPDLVAAMSNLLRLLAVGGELVIDVPYDLSYGAWQDPTHVRAFNERSWLYYTDWWWYLGWTEARFDLTALHFTYSPLGQELAQRGVSQDEIVRTPRAVDSMHAVLRKRLLSEAEQVHGQAMRGEARITA